MFVKMNNEIFIKYNQWRYVFKIPLNMKKKSFIVSLHCFLFSYMIWMSVPPFKITIMYFFSFM